MNIINEVKKYSALKRLSNIHTEGKTNVAKDIVLKPLKLRYKELLNLFKSGKISKSEYIIRKHTVDQMVKNVKKQANKAIDKKRFYTVSDVKKMMNSNTPIEL